MLGHRIYDDIGSFDFTAAFPSHILPRSMYRKINSESWHKHTVQEILLLGGLKLILHGRGIHWISLFLY